MKSFPIVMLLLIAGCQHASQALSPKVIPSAGCPRMVSVYFNDSSDKLTQDDKKVLDVFAACYPAHPHRKVKIAGNTDGLGSPESNLSLSTHRAETVFKYLSKKGVNEANMTAIANASTHPVAPDDNSAGRLQNRRVDVSLE
ncbi:MAG: OmpA family protein [Myxococcota bacterium]